MSRCFSFLLAVLLLLLMPMSVGAASLPSPDWVYLQEEEDRVRLCFETPASMRDQVDAYELRTDFTDWMPVADGVGGSVYLQTGGYVYLRYRCGTIYSSAFSAYVQFGQGTIVRDSISGVSAAYRASANFPEQAYIIANRVTGGTEFDAVRAAVPNSKYFELYEIHFLYADGRSFLAGNGAQIRIPLHDDLKRDNCSVFFVDEQNQRMLSLPVTYDRTDAVFRSRGAGLYYIVSEWNGVSAVPAAKKPLLKSRASFYGIDIVYGDADMDGVVNAADARMVLRASVRLETLNAVQEECADADADGQLSASDARAVLRCSVGLS